MTEHYVYTLLACQELNDNSMRKQIMNTFRSVKSPLMMDCFTSFVLLTDEDQAKRVEYCQCAKLPSSLSSRLILDCCNVANAHTSGDVTK